MHFGHSNMIKYENRPFKDIYEMEEVIIRNWNNKIKKEYYVYVLGDVSFYPKEKTKEIINQLNGRKILIMGNHDKRKSTKYWKEVGFEDVSKYPILFDDKYLLSHEPRYEIASSRLYFNIHGHLHSKEVSNKPEMFFNVSVERNNYRPVDFEKVEMTFEG